MTISSSAVCCGCCAPNAWKMPNEKPALVQEHESKGRRLTLEDGQSIFVRDEGRQQDDTVHQQKTVVMIHGVPASSLLYRKFFDPLTKQHGYRAIAVDLPGLGFSDKPLDRDYSWPAMAKTLEEVLHHKDLGLVVSGKKTKKKNLHLVIHDIGGPIGALYAAEHPDQVASITVLDTLFDIETFQKPFPMFFFPMPIIGTIAIKTFTPWIVRQFMHMRGVQDKSSCDHEEAMAWVWQLKNNQGSATFSKIMKSFPRQKDDKKQLTAKIKQVLGEKEKIPMQIVWAAGEVAIPTYQRQYIQDNFNVQHVHEVAGRHFFQLESAGEIVDHIHNFLQEQQKGAK